MLHQRQETVFRFQKGVLMNKTSLLASTILALTAASASAAWHPSAFVKPGNIHPVTPTTGVLYSQNSNFGYGIDSQNFTSGSFSASYNSAAADDFVVPAGHVWKISALDVTGVFYNGSGPATSEIVTFYRNDHGRPGRVKRSFTLTCNLAPQAGYDCTLPKKAGVPLGFKGGAGGREYWLSFVVNCSFVGGCGQWGWVQNTVTHNKPGQWENPGNGFGTNCTTWTNTSSCIAGAADDYAFDLVGT